MAFSVNFRGGSRLVPVIAAVSAVLAVLPIEAFASDVGKITSGFGVRRDPINGSARLHAGTDMAAPNGHYVYATGDGIVQRARWASGYGLLVELAHGYGYQSRFGHLSRVLVAEGQMVRRGQVIGLVGSTGRSTGPHLHYEVRINGKPVDSRRYMQIVFANPPSFAPANRAASTQMARQQAPTGVAGAKRPRAVGRISSDEINPEPQNQADLDGNAPGSSFGHVPARPRW